MTLVFSIKVSCDRIFYGEDFGILEIMKLVPILKPKTLARMGNQKLIFKKIHIWISKLIVLKNYSFEFLIKVIFDG